MEGTRVVNIADQEFGNDFELLFPIPQPGASWGVFTPLLGTAWEPLIPVVTGAALSHALHGFTKELREQLGRPPARLGGLLPHGEAVCALRQTCLMAKAECIAGAKGLPLCFEAPLPLGVSLPASLVAISWSEGRYVAVIDGEEFSL